jgi:hypothetical protein
MGGEYDLTTKLSMGKLRGKDAAGFKAARVFRSGGMRGLIAAGLGLEEGHPFNTPAPATKAPTTKAPATKAPPTKAPPTKFPAQFARPPASTFFSTSERTEFILWALRLSMPIE